MLSLSPCSSERLRKAEGEFYTSKSRSGRPPRPPYGLQTHTIASLNTQKLLPRSSIVPTILRK